LALRQAARDELERLPALDTDALHALGDALAGTDPQPLAAFVDTVNAWLSQRLDGNPSEIGRMARLAEAWERINQAARDAETYNLERKPLVFGVSAGLPRPRAVDSSSWPGPSRPSLSLIVDWRRWPMISKRRQKPKRKNASGKSERRRPRKKKSAPKSGSKIGSKAKSGTRKAGP
jgi:hypothetical protein